MPRKQSDTSRFAYEKIMKGRDSHYKKIILALEWLVEGNNWEIAKQAQMKPLRLLSIIVPTILPINSYPQNKFNPFVKSMAYCMGIVKTIWEIYPIKT